MLKQLQVCLLVTAVLPTTGRAQIATAELDDGRAVYGPGIFPAITRIQTCENYGVLVAYLHGTDMVFVDEVRPALNGSTLEAVRGFSFLELNAYHASASIERVECELEAPESLNVSGFGYSFHGETEFAFTISLSLRNGSYHYRDSLGRNNRHPCRPRMIPFNRQHLKASSGCIAVPPNMALQRTCRIVTRFAYANCAIAPGR